MSSTTLNKFPGTPHCIDFGMKQQPLAMAQTTAAAFSARARPGMGVSMPVSWEQLRELKSGRSGASQRRGSTCRSRRATLGRLLEDQAAAHEGDEAPRLLP